MTAAGMYNPIEFVGICVYCSDPNSKVLVKFWRDEAAGRDVYEMSKCNVCKKDGTFGRAPVEWDAIIESIYDKRTLAYRSAPTREDITNIIMNAKYAIQDESGLTEKEKNVITVFCQYLYFSLAKSPEELTIQREITMRQRMEQSLKIEKPRSLTELKMGLLPTQQYRITREEVAKYLKEQNNNNTISENQNENKT